MNQSPIQEEWFNPPGAPAELAAVDIEAAEHLRFVLHQTFRYSYAGPVANVEQRLVVVPPARHGSQHRVAHALSVEGAPGQASWSSDDFANSVARVRVPAVAESVEFQVRATIDRFGHAPVRLPGAALRHPGYRTASVLTVADGTLTAAAHDAVGGVGPGIASAERVCSAVYAAVQYRKGATTVGTTAAEALRIGAGVCQDHAHVMLAMCRTLGMPARYVSGHLLGEGATHAWVEVIVPDPEREDGAIAVPFDPCHNRRPGATYVTVAAGRDYQDVAPTSGTYDGRFANRLTSVTRLGVSVVEGPTRAFDFRDVSVAP